MKLIVTENNVGILAATYVKDRIKAFNPSLSKPFVMALPTGGTAVDFYKYLVDFYKKGQISFKHVVTFNLDEYINLDSSHPESYHSYMKHNLFDHIDINPENINIPNGNASDLDAFCSYYEEKIKSFGGIELFLGGVGHNGHIAFNEPGSPFDSKTRVVSLSESTIKANARFFDNNINLVPKQAVTMGLGTILSSKEIIIMATGESKSEAVYRAIEGRPDTNWSITALQNHKDAYLLCDVKAASQVSTVAAAKCGVCSFTPPEDR